MTLMDIAWAEARARSRRTGIPESPGALPSFTPQLTTADMLARREAVIAAIRNGAHETFAINQVVGFDAFNVLAKLVREGRVTRVRQKNGRWFHEVAG